MIAGLRDLGKTIFLTTHYMEEAQRLADRVAIIAAGRIVAEGRRTSSAAARRARPRSASGCPAGVTAGELPGGLEAEPGGDGELLISTTDPGRAAQPAHGLGARASIELDGLQVEPAEPRGHLPRARPAPRPRRRRTEPHERLALALHQFRYDQKTFWRNPAAVFFTVAFPLMFLLIFELIFGDDTLEQLGNLKTDTYYVPAILTLAIVSATMQSVAIRLTTERENGILKRGRGTPMPPWVFFAGRIGNAIVISLLMLIVVPGIGRLIYGVAIPWEHLPAVLVTLAIGAASFCALGVALTAIIPTEEAAPAITNVVILPLYFLSGVFIPETEIPDGVLHVADMFPIRHFFEAFFAAWNPLTAAPASSGATWPSSRPGASPASCSRSASSAGRRGAARSRLAG